jgi:enamine deaminase RidA (YjgF/YER057c/UK114 family)
MGTDLATELSIVCTDGLEAISLVRPRCTEHFITVQPETEGPSFEMFGKMADFLRTENAVMLKQYVFGGTALHDEGMQALEDAGGPVNWPVTWLQGDACSGAQLTGTQAYALSGNGAQRINMDGRPVGTVFEDSDARYCLLGNLQETDTSLSREVQARRTFEKMEEALRLAKMDFSNVVRTWIYLNNLLTWYDEFNVVRTQFYRERGVFERMVPASTGIGTSNPTGGVLVTGVLAVEIKQDRVRIEAVPSPLQCPATSYKSSFSRAVEMTFPDHRRVYVSGTASIDPHGKTIHIGDPARQIACTMEVVSAILECRGLNWSDTTRGIAYFKNIGDAGLFREYCRRNSLPRMPIAIAHSDVCRDELLFELEIDAFVVT